ncbi:MAG TPA: DUF192 domain-containing protein [Candidatus Bathyarchaeia archaeon]|nr:DUF192 domain-containing protein [Candidatus Bathyarchaeia archaeon]
MHTVRVLNTSNGSLLGQFVAVADTMLSRIVGLLGRARLEVGEGMLIIPSQAVHTLAMRFPIDVLFLDRKWRVIHVQPELAPNRVTGLHCKARCVLELPAGVIAATATSVGDEILIAQERFRERVSEGARRDD